ncbi:MAG: hypothetical protein HQL26_02815 [Candidatus Omnitrophica bacterium]|nr:hypothetical protein [Candidatus Omnitrophota bacterium]
MKSPNFSSFLAAYVLILSLPFLVGCFVTPHWLVPTTLMFLFASLGLFIYSRLKHRAEIQLLAQQKL